MTSSRFLHHPTNRDYRGLKKQIKAIRKTRQPSTFLQIDSDSDRDSPGDSSDSNAPQPVASGSDSRGRSKVAPSNGSPVNGFGQGHGRSESKYGSTGVTPPLFGRENYGSHSKQNQSSFVGIGKRSESPPPVELPQPALPIQSEDHEGQEVGSSKGKSAQDTVRTNASTNSLSSASNSVQLPEFSKSRVILGRAKSEQFVCVHV